MNLDRKVVHIDTRKPASPYPEAEDVTLSVEREFIVKHGTWLLRTVAEGGSTDATEFWMTTLAMEAVLDDDDLQVDYYYRELQRYERHRA